MTTRPPTATRPLLGQTVLVVEDSRFACEAMRLLCLRSGARIRRADSLRSARKHLTVYRPTVVIVDIGLPDGNGLDLVQDIAQAVPRVEVLLATSGNSELADEATVAGADGFFEKPLTSLAAFQNLVLKHLPAEQRPRGPRTIMDEDVVPDPIAFQDDMAHISDVLSEEHAPRVLDYVTQFIDGVASSAQDDELKQAAARLAAVRAEGAPLRSVVADLSAVVQKRLNSKIAI
ncbi:response regulator [Algirhabdus cladophorae]|uniref:response regulator n=1 Tax=Algirhabdus cladophorae TaxID=3377108 RepID=UPI003B849CDF